MVSVIIPARNEPYLQNTIDSILSAASGEVEVTVVLDGYWPDPIVRDDARVRLIHFSEPHGMRAAINAAARVSQGKHLLKCDAHCLFDKGFDEKLKADCGPDWMVVPRRYGLDINTWTKTDKLYEFQYVRQTDFKGKNWPEYADRVKGQQIVDLMTSQGSCWFIHRDRFWDLGGLDEANYGSMGKEAQEVCLKTWLSGGRYVLNRNTWYAHWNKDTGLYKDVKEEKRKSADFALRFWTGDHGYKHSLSWLVEKFAPVPTWDGAGGNGHEISKEKNAESKENEKAYTKNFEQIDSKRIAERNGREGVGRKEENKNNPEQSIKKGIPETGLRRYFIEQKRIRKDILSPIMVRGYQRNRHLYRLFNDMGLKKGVEVGVRGGSNALNICKHIANVSLGLVDLWRGDRHYARVERILAPYDVQLIRKKSMDALNDFERESLDFGYIDANHTFDYFMEDLIGWSKKIRSGGIIAGHDYFHWTEGNIVLAVNAYVQAHGIKDLFITDEPIPSFFWVKT